MAQFIADRKDVDFVLHDQLGIENLKCGDRFHEYNKKVVDMIISEARNLAVKELMPTMKISDEKGCEFENREVKTPDEFKRCWELLKDGEWVAPVRDIEIGGQGMPESLWIAVRDYLTGGNLPLMLLISLTHGAGHLIELFGSKEQKSIYLKKLYSGEWTGTMLLTEPQAGSDLSAIETTATLNNDGTYSLTGNKIFITFGEHDLSPNIIHTVLARIKGASEGSDGISLFVVPKFLLNADGSLGERNDIICTGLEKKMGLHGSPTCAISLGTKSRCVGTLLGKAHKGLAQMFVMMNEERLMVGSQALSCASSAYLHALSYARTRIQGKSIQQADSQPVPIIKHPDVRRMLLTMKTFVEGMRSLLYYLAYCEDKKILSDTNEKKIKFQNLIDVLIPIGKGYVSDRAVDVCNIGIQVFGGYGYTRDYPAEQLLRDVRICPIYEGTNGIQAIDLLNRKLGMKNGQLFIDMIQEIKKTILEAKSLKRILIYAEIVENAIHMFERVVSRIKSLNQGSLALNVMANAGVFFEVTGDIAMAWMLLWRAVIAERRLIDNAPKKDVAFLEGQLKSAEFFLVNFLPLTHGRMTSLMDPCGAAVEISNEGFGGL